MVIASVQVKDKERRARFFQETFLVVDTCMEVILGMPFLTLSMQTWFLQKRTYLKITDQKEFAPPALDFQKKEAFVATFTPALKISVHPVRESQIASLNLEGNQPRCCSNVPTSMSMFLIENKVTNHLMCPSPA